MLGNCMLDKELSSVINKKLLEFNNKETTKFLNGQETYTLHPEGIQMPNKYMKI